MPLDTAYKMVSCGGKNPLDTALIRTIQESPCLYVCLSILLALNLAITATKAVLHAISHY